MGRAAIPPRISVIIDGKLAGVVRKISREGISFSTPKTLEQGKGIKFGLLLPGMARAVELEGRVRETFGDKADVEFINLAPDTIAAIDSIMRKVDETHGAFEGKKRILLVDDSKQIRSIYKGRLMLDGYEVIAVESALDAMAYLRDETPDLVLLDLVMPVMDGFKLLKIIRETSKLSDLPVIILSARGAVAEIEKAFAIGISGYLIKTTTSPVKLSREIKDFFSRAA